MASAEAGPLRMMLTLGIAGLFSGAALVGIFLATEDIIKENQVREMEEAIFEVLPGAKTKKAFVKEGDALAAFAGAEGTLPKEPAVYEGFDAAGERVGFAIPAVGTGFQDKITLIYGIDPATRKLIGMKVLEHLETPGLGDKIVKDDEFVSQFAGLAADPTVEVTKKGKTKPNQIDAISGATISSKAVAKIINGGNEAWLDLLPTAAHESSAEVP